MRDLFHAYWLAGGRVAELWFRVVVNCGKIGDWPVHSNKHYFVEAVHQGSGIPQFNCGHHHKTHVDALECKRLLVGVRIEMESNLVG